MTRSGDGSVLARILSAALKRRFERTLEEELRELGEIALPEGLEERVWSRVRSELEAA